MQTRHRVLVLQHPREANYKLGSVSVLRRALPDVTVRVGVDFTDDPEIARTVRDPLRRAVLLFPREGGDVFPLDGSQGRLTFLVLDGTWSQVKTMLKANTWMASLPYLRLSPTHPSVYRVRHQPYPWGLCTLEAVAEALVLVDGDVAVRRQLSRPLHALLGMHLACSAEGTSDILQDRELLEQASFLPRAP